MNKKTFNNSEAASCQGILASDVRSETTSVKTAARILGVSKGTIRRWIRDGILGAEKIAGQYCISRFPDRGIAALPSRRRPRQTTIFNFLGR